MVFSNGMWSAGRPTIKGLARSDPEDRKTRPLCPDLAAGPAERRDRLKKRFMVKRNNIAGRGSRQEGKDCPESDKRKVATPAFFTKNNSQNI